jgi:hypothetical protein
VSHFVLDASVALAWFVDNPVSAYATQIKGSLLRGARAVVPPLWHLEMANGLAVAERRGILTTADAHQGVCHIEYCWPMPLTAAPTFSPSGKLWRPPSVSSFQHMKRFTWIWHAVKGFLLPHWIAACSLQQAKLGSLWFPNRAVTFKWRITPASVATPEKRPRTGSRFSPPF